MSRAGETPLINIGLRKFDILKQSDIISVLETTRKGEKTMNILKRVWLIIASNLNALLNKAEDPEKIMDQVVSELGENMQEVRKQLAGAMRDYAQIERKLAQNIALVKDYDNKAMLALKSGNEELALEALRRKEATEVFVASLQNEVNEQNRLIEQLEINFKTLETRVEEARTRKGVLVAQNRRAEARIKSVQSITATDKQAQLLEAFDRMAEKISDTEDMAVAITMVTQQSFDERLNALEKEDNAQKRLDEMKRRLGMKTAVTKINNDAVEDAQLVTKS